MSKEYNTVSIPKAVFSKLKKIVGHAGYRSVAEIVMFCIRKQNNYLDQLIEDIRRYENDKSSMSIMSRNDR